MQPRIGAQVLYNHPERGMVIAFITREYERVLVPDRGEYGSYDYSADLFLLTNPVETMVGVLKSFENGFEVGKWNFDTDPVRQAARLQVVEP